MLRKFIVLVVCLSAAAYAVGACGGSSSTGDGGTCSAPNVQCGATCSNPQTDPQNCGACGTVCSAGQVCSAGSCAAACGGGTTQCGMSCVETQVDPANCGGCGKACGAGQACSMGMCGTACGTGLTSCPTDAGVTACIDTTSDNSNCGSCGNTCGVNTTCQGSACVPNLTNIGPTNVSGTMTCSADFGVTGRKVAIDDANNIYVAMLCTGTTTQATLYVASSQNGGLSYGTPLSTALPGEEGAIIVGTGSKPALYAATTSTGGPLLISVSNDLGKTWSPQQTLVATANANYDYGVSMAMYQSTLYVAVSSGVGSATLTVLRDGVGIGDAGLMDVDDAGFSSTTANLVQINLNDIAVDPSNGNVWAMGEYNGAYHIAVSSNGGLSFGPAVSPPGGGLDTDWVLANGTLFAAGTTDLLYAVPTTAPTTQTTVPGLGAAGVLARSIAVDANANIYVATGTGTSVNVARILAARSIADAGPTDGGSSIDSIRTLPGAANSASITARAANAAVVAFSAQGHVYASTLAY